MKKLNCEQPEDQVEMMGSTDSPPTSSVMMVLFNIDYDVFQKFTMYPMFSYLRFYLFIY